MESAELHAALVNALERIATMEQKWAELETEMENLSKEMKQMEGRRSGDGATTL